MRCERAAGRHVSAHLEKYKGNREREKQEVMERRGGGVYVQVTSREQGEGSRVPMTLSGCAASSDIGAVIWELTGRGWAVGGGGFPAEDKSNKCDMTLPKANLAPLRDDLSGFSTPHVLLRGKRRCNYTSVGDSLSTSGFFFLFFSSSNLRDSCG